MQKSQNSPPPGYVGVQATDVLVTGPVPVCPVYGPHPQNLICPSCHAQVITRVHAETSTKTHLIAALLCLVSCCCLPYCIDSCKDKNHYCPNCNAYLGTYN